VRYYRRYPDRALAGMTELTLEQIGAYNLILDLLYQRDGVVRDDDRMVAHAISIDLRLYRRVKTELVAAGKVRNRDGFLSANGVDVVLAQAQLKSSSARAAGQLRHKRDENANDYNHRPDKPLNDRSAILQNTKYKEEPHPKLSLEERLPTETEIAAMRRLGEIK
jgi:uncharacterized protein YdaU (DUF1376 family)